MDLRAYAEFVGFAVVVILVPGPDFAVTVKNTLAGGARRGRATAFGISTSNACQGAASAAGLGALIVRSQPLFETIRWCGVAYLLYLAAQAARSAIRPGAERPAVDPPRAHGFRQGFLSNITNPKVLAFYVAVLPQFVTTSTAPAVLLVFALTHAVLGLVWLLVVVGGVEYARRWLARTRARRVLDGITSLFLAGFAGRLALERA
ncbi:MAG TPA: LysE family translocator [Gaiellaceae bacterium]|jgi:threonine/homoserine/homoserine lactone efflux protein